MKVLVTAGGTREPIDRVRYISNGSTGATGAAVADALHVHGHDVHLLRGLGAVAPQVDLPGGIFSSAADLEAQLRAQLFAGDFDAVIMAAAVADYRPQTTHNGKLSSTSDSLVLKLERVPKILAQLRGFSPRPLCVVGFKLTVANDPAVWREAVHRQFAESAVDAVVHNDLHEIESAATHPFRLHRTPDDTPPVLPGVSALADALHALLEETR